MLLIAGALAAVAVGIGWWRSVALSRGVKVLLVLAMAFLCLAAGELTWNRKSAGRIAVMIDLSPSTRTAAYRDRRYLQQRISELIGSAPYQMIYFGESNQGNAKDLGDLPATMTIYDPPAADAVLLFSDAQFDLPKSAPPTYTVVDPALKAVVDASVRELRIADGTLHAHIENTGAERKLELRGATESRAIPVAPDSWIIQRAIGAGAESVAARLGEGDPWPENDQLILAVTPPLNSERWWISDASAPAGYRAIAPEGVPSLPGEYLAPSVIVLDNVPASDLTAVQQQRLAQYVRDLGGSLVINGGDRAYASGGYSGSTIEKLSPLASQPPAPAHHWIVLLDSSGSMDRPAGNSNRWQRALDALRQGLPQLPPDDLLTVGSFAQDISWWTSKQPVRESFDRPLPPETITPRGPTNLQPALAAVALALDATLPAQLLIITDGEASLSDLGPLLQQFSARRMQVHVLAIERSGSHDHLQQLAEATGGTFRSEEDPDRWVVAVCDLLQAATPPHMMDTPIELQTTGTPPLITAQTIQRWNRTWAKARATILARGATADGQVPLAARWQAGTGAVAAVSFPARPADVEPLVDSMAHAPRDPRFSITWHDQHPQRVTVNAADESGFMNGLALRLQITPVDSTAGAAVSMAVSQISPGRYETTFDARMGAFASVYLGDQLLDRTVLPRRYAMEFEQIGNNPSGMEELARRTGGTVIRPDQRSLLPLQRAQSVLLAPYAAVIAAGLMAWALLRARR